MHPQALQPELRMEDVLTVIDLTRGMLAAPPKLGTPALTAEALLT